MAERDVNWHSTENRSRVQAIAEDVLRGHAREPERLKAARRAPVEHRVHVVKIRTGDCKVRDKGLAKNANHQPAARPVRPG